MEEPIEDTYFNWLYSKVASVNASSPSLKYWTLLRDLHCTEFVWLVSGDDNRAEDGIALRHEFVVATNLDENFAWMHVPCSVLEMLIAFSRRAAFETDVSPREWFWIFLDNLGLKEFTDAVPNTTVVTSNILDQFVWRTFDRNGNGGLFPLSRAQEDQRKVEIRYQFCDYLVDKDIL